ncbi:uncharacterized protein [Nicotiana sylvestris]|uniref:uncharacterized protein n=1 Tax=Nicotiana sylvestris TaxID=4096 RepID=UPI00388CC929
MSRSGRVHCSKVGIDLVSSLCDRDDDAMSSRRETVLEVLAMSMNGHLREFLSDRAKNNYDHNRDNGEPSKAGEEPPRQTINMIFGGNEINEVTFSVAKKTKVSITHSKSLREDDITFTKEDAVELLLPHNDALEISLNMLDFKIIRVLVDPGSSSNIIQWRVLEETKLTEIIIPPTKLLVGFNLASLTTRGEILLLMNAEGVMKMTLFGVVDGDMGYNIILGRPYLHEMKVVPSTYHQLLKFPMPEGIKQLRGDERDFGFQKQSKGTHGIAMTRIDTYSQTRRS